MIVQAMYKMRSLYLRKAQALFFKLLVKQVKTSGPIKDLGKLFCMPFNGHGFGMLLRGQTFL